MADTFEVQYVTKNPNAPSTEQITHIGGVNSRGRAWRLTRAEAIEGINSGRWSFYVTVRGERASLLVGINPSGARYLKTELDDGDPRTLLGLPDCTVQVSRANQQPPPL